MKLLADPTFTTERRRFALRMHCEDCALWDERRDACAHGYPTAEHRQAAEDAGAVVFCKDFEVA